MLRTQLRRRAFTLVELLVAIAVIIVLSALALLVVPGIMEQDRTTDGASLTRQYLMLAKARAARDQAPRGVRFIVDTNKPLGQQMFATEIQYTEAPLVIPNRNGGWYNGSPDSHPNVLVEYILAPNNPPGWPPLPPATPPGTVVARRITVTNLGSYEADVGPNAYMALLDWNIWIKLPQNFSAALGEDGHLNGNGTVAFYVQCNAQNPPGQYDVNTYGQVVAALDPIMGGSNQARTYLGGGSVYASPRPLVGEKTQPLPKGICVDLISSRPQGLAGQDYDIVFAPNGQVLFRGDVQINLWVRDLTKNGGDTNPPPAGVNGVYATGGEQQVVALKKSGALGVFPIAFVPGAEFQFAQLSASAPSQ